MKPSAAPQMSDPAPGDVWEFKIVTPYGSALYPGPLNSVKLQAARLADADGGHSSPASVWQLNPKTGRFRKVCTYERVGG